MADWVPILIALIGVGGVIYQGRSKYRAQDVSDLRDRATAAEMKAGQAELEVYGLREKLDACQSKAEKDMDRMDRKVYQLMTELYDLKGRFDAGP